MKASEKKYTSVDLIIMFVFAFLLGVAITTVVALSLLNDSLFLQRPRELGLMEYRTSDGWVFKDIECQDKQTGKIFKFSQIMNYLRQGE